MLHSNKNSCEQQFTTGCSKLQEIITLIISKTNIRPRSYGKGYIVRCTAHNDKNPSLSIAEGVDGKVLLKCFSGCRVDDICASLGIKMSDLFPKKTRR